MRGNHGKNLVVVVAEIAVVDKTSSDMNNGLVRNLRTSNIFPTIVFIASILLIVSFLTIDGSNVAAEATPNNLVFDSITSKVLDQWDYLN
jgi:hypothetical protein